MDKEKYYFEHADFKLFIYYKEYDEPLIVDRNSISDLDKWLNNKHNKGNLKGCNKWIIRDNQGVTVKEGKVLNEILTKIIVKE